MMRLGEVHECIASTGRGSTIAARSIWHTLLHMFIDSL